MVVVVRVKGGIRVVNLGSTVLYIFAGPIARLMPLKRDVHPRSRLQPVKSGDDLKEYPGDHTGSKTSLKKMRGDARRSQKRIW